MIEACELETSERFTLQETNSKFARENGWLEDFLVSFWDGLVSWANC